MSIQLHETVMGRRLIEHTLPKIGNALDKLAKGMEKPKETGCYLVASHYYNNEEAMGEVNSNKTHDKWGVYESLKEAKMEYKKELENPLLRSAALTRIVDGTDWWV